MEWPITSMPGRLEFAQEARGVMLPKLSPGEILSASDIALLASSLSVNRRWLSSGGGVFQDGWYFVYRLLSSVGEVLYVGATANITLRTYQHSRTEKWIGVAGVSYQLVEGKSEAAELERESITKYSPARNFRTSGYRGERQRIEDDMPGIACRNVADGKRGTLHYY